MYSAVRSVVDVEFLTEFGDLPMLTADVTLLGGNVTITRRVKGTRSNLECSMLGNCDEDTGRCKCLPGYGSIFQILRARITSLVSKLAWR